MQNKPKIHVRFGNMKLVKIKRNTGEIVEEKWIESVSAAAPIIVISEKRDWYIRGIGILVKTKDANKYCIQLCSLDRNVEGIVLEYRYKILSAFGNLVIIDYNEYGKLLGVLRGYKINYDNSWISFSKGKNQKGTGIVFKPLELEYSGRVPLEIYYPYGKTEKLAYPKEVKKVPIEREYKYLIEVVPEKLVEFVNYVDIPNFAIRINQ